jgi:hypothetical protein
MGITGHLPAIPPQQTGRKLDRSAISRRVSGRRADAAGAGSKSSLRGGHENRRRALEWADVCPQGTRTMTKPLVCRRQRASQFPLRPYTIRKVSRLRALNARLPPRREAAIQLTADQEKVRGGVSGSALGRLHELISGQNLRTSTRSQSRSSSNGSGCAAYAR